MTARKWSRIARRDRRTAGRRARRDVLRRLEGHRERAAARWPRHRVGPHDDLRPDAGYVGAQRQQPGAGRRRLRRPGALDRAEELDRHPDARHGAERQASGERAGQDRPDQPAGQPARAAGPAAGPVVAAVEGRRHHSAEELVGVPDDGAGAGQHLDRHPRWRHPEPRGDPDRGEQSADRPGRSDP